LDGALFEIVKLAASLISILFVAWMVRRMGLGGDMRIRDEAHASELAEQALCGFEAVDIAIDRAGIGALLRDAQGRQMVLRRHGAQFVGRLLDSSTESRLDQNFLTIGTSDRHFGTVTLNLGERAQAWAAGLRRIQA
jgi:hypothetical protein